MTVKTYRKKPVEIEAMEVLKPYKLVADWCGGTVIRNDQDFVVGLTIHTLEGDMRAERGDFIIRGVNGEFYPCKPDIFAKTYEVVA